MTDTTPTAPLILHNRYHIKEKLGTGRLAVVYRAEDERLQRSVLFHILRKDLLKQAPLRQRFVQEAHDRARCSHQSLLEIYDSGEISGRPYMITEFVTGHTLRELGALSLDEALLYFRQIVGAVAACQTAGVPHPPVSSNNIMVVAEGHVELLENWQTSQADVILDTARYRAPEHAQGQRSTQTSTVYALGLLLFELLTGQRAVEGTDPKQVAQAHVTAHIPSLSDIRRTLYLPSLEKLLQQATARNPQERIPDATALAQELDTMRRTIGSDTKRLPTPPVRPPSLRERLNRTASGFAPQQVSRPRTTTDQIPRQSEAAQPAPQYNYQAQNRSRSIVGITVFFLMFSMTACGTYYFATLAVERFVNFEFPRPSLGISLPSGLAPEWLTGFIGGQGEPLVITVSPGVPLNVREEPGLSTAVLGVVSNGDQVRWLGDVETVDGVPWIYVRGPVDVQENGEVTERVIEGWLSANFAQTLSGEAVQFQ
ncbi:MAG: protein kinase [Chloroflexi bacterium AL-W]|nr:protein kinase [Chloroflexi bacterium AL-N1]NOK68176.1 protein kinase [Chloroflexi bacterium AL-N10]NOK73516.1 protein kinase [Chloroflexi bacterium AL-N5]NOK84050.1 protein kinase [Chloroflexi bacterium AL-W]NOK87847.1 protein kinase [Chloroflexi bacterium AL-N15]